MFGFLGMSRGPTVIQIQGTIGWQIYHDPSGYFIGVCPALNLNATADTWSEFLEAVNGSMDLLFNVLLKKNELDDFLRHRGWTKFGDIPVHGRVRFEVPFDSQTKRRYEELELAHA